MITQPTSSTARGQPAPVIANRLLFLGVLMIILVAGLDPKGYHFHNDVTRLADGPGLHFGRFGRAHTGPFMTPDQADKLNAAGFTIEAVTTLTNLDNGSFRLLATFHSGDDGSQLLIGQWRQFLVVMNGDDYDHTRKFPRLTAEIPATNLHPTLLTITTGPAGTRLYLDGKRTAFNRHLHLIMPSSPEPARLTLGASIHASNPWQGDIRGFGLVAGALSREEVSADFDRWKEQNDFSNAADERPLLLYRFTDRGTGSIRNEGSLAAPLFIPTGLWAIGRRALAPLDQHANHSRSDLEDSIVNLLGFIPFGITLALVLRPFFNRRRMVIFAVTLTGFLLSLVIELTQAWIPSRDSSLHDLLLNTIGGFLGALCIEFLHRRSRATFTSAAPNS